MSSNHRTINVTRKIEAFIDYALYASNKLLYYSKSIPKTGIPYYYRCMAWKNWINSGNYKRRPNPFKIVYIPPGNIKYNSKRRFSYLDDMYADSGMVCGGEWDQNLNSFKNRTIYESPEPENTIYRMIKERFVEKKEWKKIRFVRRAIETVKERPFWGYCRSKKDIMDRCKSIDKLYKKIKENGYKPKKCLVKSKSINKNPDWFEFVYDEVVCNIGRSGRFLFVGGHHRLSIAKILGISKIPVRIFVRHKEWQEIRDSIQEGGKVPDNFESHPDTLGLGGW